MVVQSIGRAGAVPLIAQMMIDFVLDGARNSSGDSNSFSLDLLSALDNEKGRRSLSLHYSLPPFGKSIAPRPVPRMASHPQR